MDLITTFDEYKNINNTYDQTDITYTEIQRKKTIDQFHDGHITLLNETRLHGNKLVLNFPKIDELLYMDSNHINNDWDGDKDICSQWALDQNVDILIWLDPLESFKLFEPYDLVELQNWAEDYITTHGYTGPSVEIYSQFLKWGLIWMKTSFEDNIFKFNNRTFSWKDGIWRFYQKNFIENYLGVSANLAPCLIDPTYKFPYGNVFATATEQEKEWISQIPTFILDNTSLIKTDIETFKLNVKNSIDALDATKDFYTYDVYVYYNDSFVDPGQAFVDVRIHLNSSFRSFGMEGYFMYPLLVNV